jgi:hypothetical protein
MRPELLARLDAHWAAHLHCDPAGLHNENTNIIVDDQRTGVEVWLFGRTCVMAGPTPLARALKTSVGTRNPIVAFEPGRLRDAIAFFGLPLHGPEAILVHAAAGAAVQAALSTPAVTWLAPQAEAAGLDAALRAAAGLPALALSLKDRAARRAAEACGFELYASVIYLGDKPRYP